MNIHIDPRITQSAATAEQPPSLKKSKNLKELRESTREFEALYIFEMYKAMRKNVPESGLFNKELSTTMYQEMLDMEMARTTAGGKGMGLGEAMFNQLQQSVK